jgi:ABC-type Fe3+ transport system permease subunit/DNA-binding beta-propeller fold protein YncE
MNWTLLNNTLLVAMATTVGAVAAGFAAALWASGLGRWGRMTVIAVAVVTLVLPPFLPVNCWIDLLGETGRWKSWCPLPIYSLAGTVWILALMTWPIAFFMVLAAWGKVEKAHLEVDPMLRGTAVIRWLLLPAARTALAQSGVVTFVLALNNFAVPSILQVKVFPAEIWVNFNTTFDYMTALRLCWPMVLAPLLLVWWMRRVETPWGWRADKAAPEVFRGRLGGLWTLSACVALATIFFSVGIPLGHLAGSPGTWNELVPALAAGQAAFWHSAVFASVSATLVIGLALVTWRKPLGSVLWIPYLAPGVLLGIALIWLFNRPGLSAIYQSVGIVFLAYLIRYSAVGWNCVARAARGADPVLSDAARLEGANRWQMLRHVLWPQIRPAAVAGWYLTYLLCLWDVEVLVLIVPPGCESAAVRIFNLLHYGHNAQVNALCLLLLLTALAPLAAWGCWRLWQRGCFTVRATAWAAPVVAAGVLVSMTGGCTDSGAGGGGVKIKSQFFNQVQMIGARGGGLGQFNKPRSVAVDANDNLYVIDMTGRVQKFSPDGAFLKSYQMPETEKGKAKGMCRDRNGNIVVIEPHYCRVNILNSELKLIGQWGKTGTNFGELAFPRSVAVNSRNEYFISEYHLVERIQWFTADGAKCLGTLGKPGDKGGEFDRAEGVFVNAQDYVYAADSCNHRIEIFAPNGRFLRAYGKAGQKAGELSYPYDVCVEPSGLQFVCEFGNSRIQIFDAADEPVEILGGPGGGPGQFSNPWAICLDSKGNLYVADGMNHRVQKFIRKQPRHA